VASSLALAPAHPDAARPKEVMPNSQRTRLLVVATPTLFRRSLSGFLGRRRRIEVVGEAATGADAISQARELQPDVVVVNPGVPEGGPGLVAALGREADGVIVLTHRNNEGATSQVFQAGARAYIDVECELEDLVHAIERVHLGEIVVAGPVAETVRRHLGGERPPPFEAARLTERELEVLERVACGRSNPEISRELCITEYTVKGHLAKILSKLGLDNRVQLATYAVQNGLAPAAGAEADANFP
jgi:DNA-binding NarL/FixJ family response regulator